MKKFVPLIDLQIVVNNYDSRADVGNLVFEGITYYQNKDCLYSALMYDVVRAKRYFVVFKSGKFLTVLEK